jgi:transposase-like protein
MKHELIVIDHKKCPYCRSTRIYFISKEKEYAQHQCEACHTAWVDYVTKTLKKKVRWIK